MGFLGGLIGGATLTTGILYLTAAIHRSNRTYQTTLVSQQNKILTNLIDPQLPPPRDRMKEVQAGVVEMAKDKWNNEIEGLLRRTYKTDWNAVRAKWEDRALAAVEKMRSGIKDAGDGK